MTRWGNPWDKPAIPNSLKKTTELLTIIKQLKYFVEEWNEPENLKVIESLNWVPSKGEKEPLNEIKELITDLKKAVENKKSNLKPSSEKIQQFYDRSKEIIHNTANLYMKLFPNCTKEDAEEKGYIKNVVNASYSRPQDKEAFSDDQTKFFANYDEVVALTVTHEFYHLYSLSFYQNSKRSHTIDSGQLFAAFDILLGEKMDQYMVFTFGIYLDFYLDGIKKQLELTRENKGNGEYPFYSYKNDLQIYSFPAGNNSIMDQNVVIIKKEDLPCYSIQKPPTELNDEYTFEGIDENIGLYGSVLFKDFPKDIQIDEGNHCLVSIYYCLLLYWKKNADVTNLKLLYRYADSGKGEEITSLPKL